MYYNETDECGICSEWFIDPRGFPCGPHTFCFKCLTDLIEYARQDYGTSFKCPLCRRGYPTSDRSLQSEGIANKFPKMILRKRTPKTRPLKHKWKPDILDRKTERSNTSKQYELFQPNFHQPKLNNHNVIPKIPSASCNTPGLQELRMGQPMDFDIYIVNRNPLQLRSIKNRVFEPFQSTMDKVYLPFINSPNNIPKMNRDLLNSKVYLPFINSPNNISKMNRDLLNPAGRQQMDFPLGNYSNSPNTTRKINRPFLEPIGLNQTKRKREKVLTGMLPRQAQSWLHAPRYVCHMLSHICNRSFAHSRI